MKNEFRREFKYGLLCYALTLVFNRFLPVPEFLNGFFLMLAICLEFIGILPENAYNKLKSWKKNIIHRSK